MVSSRTNRQAAKAGSWSWRPLSLSLSLIVAIVITATKVHQHEERQNGVDDNEMKYPLNQRSTFTFMPPREPCLLLLPFAIAEKSFYSALLLL